MSKLNRTKIIPLFLYTYEDQEKLAKKKECARAMIVFLQSLKLKYGEVGPGGELNNRE